jgi:hypothetical protein
MPFGLPKGHFSIARGRPALYFSCGGFSDERT